MQTSTSSLQAAAAAEVQLLQRLTQDRERPSEGVQGGAGERSARASLQDLAAKLPSMSKQLSSRTSAPLAWGEDLLWSASA